jgi:solute carrier family 45, member 1/2/4
MTLPSVPDSGEDPTMQIPWPSAASRTRPQSEAIVVENDVLVPTEEVAKVSTSTTDAVKQRLTTWNLITLSISMAGAQIAWTVELGYDRI